MATFQELLNSVNTQALSLKQSIGSLADDEKSRTLTLPASAPTPLETTLSAALSGVSPIAREQTIMEKFAERRRLASEGAKAREELIKSEAETTLGETRKLGEREITSEREASRGFATNTVALREIQEMGEKRIRNLTKARDELILQNKISEASRLDDLMFAEEEATTTARQNYINTLFQLSSEARAQREEDRRKLEFETPSQKRQAERETKEQDQLDELRIQFADVPGINKAKNLTELLGFIGPEIAKDRNLQRRLQEAKIRETNAAIAAKNNSSGGRDLPATQAILLSDGQFLPGVLDELDTLISNNENLFGIISGRFPGFTDKRQKIDDDLRRAAQLVGKFMEGGVLRAEDEVKYRAMLPQLTDRNTSVARDKLFGVRQMLIRKHNQYLSDFAAAGFDVSNFKTLEELRSLDMSTTGIRSLGTSGSTVSGLEGFLNKYGVSK